LRNRIRRDTKIAGRREIADERTGKISVEREVQQTSVSQRRAAELIEVDANVSVLASELECVVSIRVGKIVEDRVARRVDRLSAAVARGRLSR
jgi:hypothetical protein